VIGIADRKDHPPWDLRTILGGQPEGKLEDEEAEDRDGTVAVRRSLSHKSIIRNAVPTPSSGTAHLWKIETERRAENDGEKTQPAETKLSVPRQAVERPRDEWAPDSSNRPAHDRVGNEPEGNDPGKKEGQRNGQLSSYDRRFSHDPSAKTFCTRHSQDKSPSPNGLYDPGGGGMAGVRDRDVKRGFRFETQTICDGSPAGRSTKSTNQG